MIVNIVFMKKYYLKIALYILLILFGIFMFIYGGWDDSPGAQGLGLLIVISSIYGLIKNKKK